MMVRLRSFAALRMTIALKNVPKHYIALRFTLRSVHPSLSDGLLDDKRFAGVRIDYNMRGRRLGPFRPGRIFDYAFLSPIGGLIGWIGVRSKSSRITDLLAFSERRPSQKAAAIKPPQKISGMKPLIKGNYQIRRGADYHSPCFFSFLILRRIMSRFSMLRCWRKRTPLR